MPYRLIYHPEALNQLETFASLEELDRALSVILAALKDDPHQFAHSPDYDNWIIVISRRYQAENKVIPSLRLYAAINDAAQTVTIMDVRINLDDRSLRM
jgi:asparagine synthetase A